MESIGSALHRRRKYVSRSKGQPNAQWSPFQDQLGLDSPRCLGSRATVTLGCIASKMVPKSRNRLARDLRVLEAISIVVEHSEFVSIHHISRWLRLDSTPDITDSLLKYCSDRRVNLALLIVPHNLKGSCYGELARTSSVSCRLTHGNANLHYEKGKFKQELAIN